jgi:hypothetical protein
MSKGNTAGEPMLCHKALSLGHLKWVGGSRSESSILYYEGKETLSAFWLLLPVAFIALYQFRFCLPSVLEKSRNELLDLDFVAQLE